MPELVDVDEAVDYLNDIIDHLAEKCEGAMEETADILREAIVQTIVAQHTGGTTAPMGTTTTGAGPGLATPFLTGDTQIWEELSEWRIKERGNSSPMLLFYGNLVSEITVENFSDRDDINFHVGVFGDEKMHAIAARMEMGSYFGLPNYEASGDKHPTPPRSYLVSTMNEVTAYLYDIFAKKLQEQVK